MYCLGDLVGYGPYQNEVIEFIKVLVNKPIPFNLGYLHLDLQY